MNHQKPLASVDELLQLVATSAQSDLSSAAKSFRAPFVLELNSTDARGISLAKVTFFHFSSSDSVQNVVMYSPIFCDTREPFQLSRYEDTKLWYRSVDLPIDTVASYSFVENDSLLPWPNTVEDEGLLCERLSRHTPDKFNPYIWKPYPDFLPTYEASVLKLRNQPQPSATKSTSLGTVEPLKLAGRDVWLYHPPQPMRGSTPTRLLILLDGDFYLAELGIVECLNKLHEDSTFAPLYVLLVDNPNETRVDELLKGDTFDTTVPSALLDAVQEHLHRSFSRSDTAIGGLSAGALAAARIACKHPTKFGRVLAQSGAFWWPWNATSKCCEKSIFELYRESKPIDLHFSMTIGIFERNPLINMLAVNREFRNLLDELGCSVRYHESATAHESLAWRETVYESICGLFPSS